MSLFDDASLVLIPDGAKASKLYSVKPTDGSGDFTFSRSTTATRVNESGLIESVATNVPRIDYSEGGCPSLLLEPQRTNLFTRSEEFDNAAWSKTYATISADATTSPDGTTSAEKIVSTVATSQQGLRQDVSCTSGQDYTVSAFIKKSDYDWFRIDFGGLNSVFDNDSVWFNINTGTVGTTDADITASIVDYGNGWYRCIATRAALATNTGRINYLLANADNVANITGDGTSGTFIWGAQLEEASYPTSYIPTNSAAVTRNADSCELTGVSSLIGQTEGTILFKTDFSESTVIHVLGQNLTVTDEQVKIEYSSTQIKFYLNDSLIATKNGTFDFSGTDEIELGNYLGGSQLGGHISNFVTV